MPTSAHWCSGQARFCWETITGQKGRSGLLPALRGRSHKRDKGPCPALGPAARSWCPTAEALPTGGVSAPRPPGCSVLAREGLQQAHRAFPSQQQQQQRLTPLRPWRSGARSSAADPPPCGPAWGPSGTGLCAGRAAHPPPAAKPERFTTYRRDPRHR